jgi:HEAT repeat protein
LLAVIGLSGCGSFLEDVTSRDFFKDLGAPKKPPLEIAKGNGDADRRARAIRMLKEPKQNGGTDQQQAEMLELLSKTATTDRHSSCRWAAIQTLGRFKDPAAVQVIEAAYDQAGTMSPESGSLLQAGYAPKEGMFQPSQTSVLRCQALLSLGQTGDPKAVDLLVRVLRQPPVEGTEEEQKLTMDEKIHAARALAHFKGDPRVTEALLAVLRDEKHIALRDRAHDSLQQVTGKKLPNDFKAWDKALHQTDPSEPDKKAAEEPAAKKDKTSFGQSRDR